MGIAWLLLKRTFTNRPKRTLLFILGYALATAVMVTLLSVGEAVLLQAQDKDLLGGGDLVLVPAGIDIESIKVGGISALYYSIPQARFIVRQLLESSRFKQEIEAVSPYIYSKLLYIRKGDTTEPAFAEGSFPDEENQVKDQRLNWRNNARDIEWLRPSAATFYHSIDHFHLPRKSQLDLRNWAEWHYFNFTADKFHGYLSFMVAGDVAAGNGVWIVSLQLKDDGYHNFVKTYPASVQELPLKNVDYSIGDNRVGFVQDHYEITLDFPNVKGKLRYDPAPGMHIPPSMLAESAEFESGYVIPALRGTYDGTLSAGGRSYEFDRVEGYHDHNWGIWRNPGTTDQPVQWNWGRITSEKYSMFFGEIFLKGKSKGLFAGLFDRHGFVGSFRPERIEFSDIQLTPDGIAVPRRLKIQQEKNHTAILIEGRAESLVTSPVENMYFVQYKMNFDVSIRIDGKTESFRASGNAETYVPGNSKARSPQFR